MRENAGLNSAWNRRWSGTPVLSTIREGLAGVRVLGLRGILNGTANHILTLMAEGLDYPTALMNAQALGYAEPDPSDDVDGHDAVAKVRILAAVAFGRTLSADEVAQRGITEVSIDDIRQAASDGARIKPVASIRLGASGLEAEVGPIALPLTDPLARIDGVTNALTIETDTLREVTIIGPGAGPEQAGQGMFRRPRRGRSAASPRLKPEEATRPRPAPGAVSRRRP